jgi:hypothetical protein
MDMKYLKSFNESSKSGKMNKKHRRNILREVNKRMKEKFVDFDDLKSGEFEKIQDEYIDIVCKEKGWTLKDFYATDGKELNDLLGI